MRKSIEAKIEEGYGKGEGVDYKPWYKAAEFSSMGTAYTFPDPINGRLIQCLSTGELYTYYLYRFQPEVENIYEQYPLGRDRTNQIAADLGVRPPGRGKEPMTTDFLVVRKDRSKEAVSVKHSRKSLKNNRIVQKLMIEKLFWESKGVAYTIVFTEELNRMEALNIAEIMRFYKLENVTNELDYVKHLVARHELDIDLTKEFLSYAKIREIIRERGIIYENGGKVDQIPGRQ